MKKICLNYLYLSEKHAGGKDQVGLNLLKGFQENNRTHNMCVLCYDYSVETIRNISTDIDIISLRNPKSQKEIVRLISILLNNSFVLPKIIKRNGIDIVFHLNCNNGFFKLKTKSVVIPHDIKAISHRDLPGLHIPLYKYLLYKIMYSMDFKHADKIISISEVDKNEISTFFPKYKNKIVRIYNPIDIIPEFVFNKNKKDYILAMNLQFHHKNIITLIKAFEMIKDKVDYNLILVGSVPKRVEYLKTYVEEKGLKDRVFFTGFVEESERNKLLKECKLYVSPTLYEGFGMVSVEAMIMCVPTLLSKIPVNYEVTKGKCNYYEPAESAEALSEALLEENNTKIDIDNIIDAAHILYDEYNIHRISEQYWACFND